jgi:murein DD-endopeptidase MepM/ murein hydrolase activator NlpD
MVLQKASFSKLLCLVSFVSAFAGVTVQAAHIDVPSAAPPTFGKAIIAAPLSGQKQIGPEETKPKSKPTISEPTLTSEEWTATVKFLRAKNLLMPIQGQPPETLKNSFFQNRGGEMHRAVDIVVPRNTPVLAVDDGTVAKLWLSTAGGTTIYQFDASGKYVYYYAHLERYAANLKDGMPVHKGQVLGYVGTSGNAPKNTPHLHFAIYKAPSAGRWWGGGPVDPYEVFAGSQITGPRMTPVEPPTTDENGSATTGPPVAPKPQASEPSTRRTQPPRQSPVRPMRQAPVHWI